MVQANIEINSGIRAEFARRSPDEGGGDRFIRTLKMPEFFR